MMAHGIKTKLTDCMAGFKSFSIALDESTDLSDTAQLAIFNRGVDKKFTVTEELLALRPLKGTTTGEDIFNEVQKHTSTRATIKVVDHHRPWIIATPEKTLHTSAFDFGRNRISIEGRSGPPTLLGRNTVSDEGGNGPPGQNYRKWKLHSLNEVNSGMCYFKWILCKIVAPTGVFLRIIELESRTKYKSSDRASRLVSQLTISVRSDKFLPTYLQAG
ncbi:General transcription factor II-I repeat domain-containing protein 2A [Eumeta japonica]|uniref:General transcription factor II-I repeat domain-containing protein 2A n=1 Tax=Eumeta variegata TaxID=151549 RepID=A0A4C1W1F5_EUMVA|nr:General transcription factor II-I repeat domain-containing protein 2A [Eumeta japonica]